MSLFCLPPKEYDALIKGISEDQNSSKSTMTLNELEDFSDKHKRPNYGEIYDFMSQFSNVKYVGDGSSRIAFCFTPGLEPYDKLAPICIKMAKNEKGIAQNKAEVDIFKKYGHKYSCFPEIFTFSTSGSYIAMELGKNILDSVGSESYKDAARWFNEWIEEAFHLYGDLFFKKNSELNDEKIKQEFEKSNLFIEKNCWPYCLVDLTYSIFKNNSIPNAKDCLQIIKHLAKNEKYTVIRDFIKFYLNDKGQNIEINDFNNAANWAFVKRKNSNYLIPIDWGFSPSVRKEFYGG